jgi:hypothetical protein
VKSQTYTNHVNGSGFALAVRPTGHTHRSETADEKNTAADTMTDRCQELQEQKQRLTDDIQAQDAELCAQLAKMNYARKDEKVDAMAAVITYMVEQRIVMDARRTKLERDLLKHAVQHIERAKESMSQCPMMRGMKSRFYNEANLAEI